MPQQMASLNTRMTSILMTTMEALGTSSYLLTIDDRVDLLEVEPGSRGSMPLPLAVGSAIIGNSTYGTITDSSAYGTIIGSSACGTITGSSACGTIMGGTTISITNLDTVSIRAKQLFPIGFEVTLVISTQAGHTEVVVDGVTLVLVIARHRQSSGPSTDHGDRRLAAHIAEQRA